MGEEIQIKSRDGKSFTAYLALPTETPAPGIVLLPEVFNTNPHIRSVADGYAADGFVVLAPNVYWRQEPGAYMSYTDEGRAKAQALRARLDTSQFAMDLEDTVGALRARSDCAGKVGVMGFCLGGKFVYLSAVRHSIDAGVSYYGVQIDQHLDEAVKLGCPLLMHFAETDHAVPQATLDLVSRILSPNRLAEIHVYPGTVHGFNRYGYPPHHEAQAAIARKRTIEHFRRHLGRALEMREDGISQEIKRIDARALKSALHDGGEIALLDAREELVFGERHILMASCLPLGRVEVLADDMVPRRSARVVWCDDGGGLAGKAARRMADLGYGDVAVLEGGIAAWEAAGFRIYSGVHVPSKAFAEVVEHDLGTPWITAEQLKAMIDTGQDITIFDSRSFEEYHTNSIPTAVSVPGGELAYRFKDLVPSPKTTVVVNCGGRTRSIIGAQSLINAGVPNKVVSLKDGTMAWHLAGFEVVQGATRRPRQTLAGSVEEARRAADCVAQRLSISRIDNGTLAGWCADRDRHTLYVLDVRTPEEYATGHVAGARSAPGGQLVQETDNYLATWGARVVLVDSDGVRAVMTASWLKQMGWTDVAVIALDDIPGERVTGPHRPRPLGLDRANALTVSPAGLKKLLDASTVTLIDLEYSKPYRNGHIPNAWFSTRTRLATTLTKVPQTQNIVLTSPDGALARIAAAEIGATASLPVLALEGGTSAWVAAGYPLAKGADQIADTADDVWLPARERGGDRESAMRAYLAWEIDLVNQMRTDDDQRFKVAKI